MLENGNDNLGGYNLSQFDPSQCDLTLRNPDLFRFWQTANKTDSKAFHTSPSLYTLLKDYSGSHMLFKMNVIS